MEYYSSNLYFFLMIELFVTCGVRTDVCEMLQPEQGRVFAHCFLLVSDLHEREPQRPCQEAKSAPLAVGCGVGANLSRFFRPIINIPVDSSIERGYRGGGVGQVVV